MGQKTSPTSTRLYGNCWPNSCWYSDENIFSLFYQDFNQKQFFDSVMLGRKFGFRPATVVCHQFPKKSFIHMFFLGGSVGSHGVGGSPHLVRRSRRLRLTKNRSRLKSKGLRMPVNKRLSAIDVAAIQHLYANKNMLPPAWWGSSGAIAPHLVRPPLCSLRFAPLTVPTKKQKKGGNWELVGRSGEFEPFKRPYNTHMSELVRLTSGSNALIIPLSLNSMLLSASLIATNISALLQQNKRLNFICKWLFKDINKYSAIKGVRISCSGRLNGKAIARTDLRKLGETSLHTFQKQIDYAKSTAITRHGVLGIKVWVSFKGEVVNN
jgi:hypothetical protein